MYMVKIKYIGGVSALNGCTISIPVDPYTYHNMVRESARPYIENVLPFIHTLQLPNDIFNHIDRGRESILIHWIIIEN